jgi:pimeloyl-ACP methyl ester carboxylesterase
LSREGFVMRSTIVLVHGAFADSGSWSSVIAELLETQHPVIAAANPLRGLASDAASVGDLIGSIDGPVVLVGHSYGGAVISNVSPDAGEIVGLVYVNGFAPQAGESCLELSRTLPGSALGDAIHALQRHDGLTDLRIDPKRFHDVFAADVPTEQAALMAATQRPATEEALTEESGDHPLWKTLPSWFVYGAEDQVIPAALHHFMAERARAHGAVRLDGASHAVAVSRPDATARTILEAAAWVGTAV